MSIHIRNPHSVLAAMETRPRDVLQISVPSAVAASSERPGDRFGGASSSALGSGDAWPKVVRMARELKIPLNPVSKAPGGTSRHPARPISEGGRVGLAEAIVKEREPLSVEALFAEATAKKGGKGLWLALDSLQDPQNIGAIFRTAAFFGVQGILLTQERSAPLSSAVYDVASGGIEYVPFAACVNLQQAFKIAKDEGLWILGTSEHANDNLSNIERDRPWLLVLGNEERGMRRLTEEACDLLCQVPPQGKVTSLNVSVAAGICIAHLAGR